MESIGLDFNPADPERAIDPERLIDQILPDEIRLLGRSDWIKLGIGMCFIVLLSVLWRWSPLSDWVDPTFLSTWVVSVRGSFLAPLIVVGAFVLGGLLIAPVTVLIVATAMVFPALFSVAYSLSGCLTSALVMFVAGHSPGRESVRKMAGKRLNKISKQLAQRGVLAVAMVRLVPVAPYSVVNLVMGASHVRLRDFLAGTVLGMLPGIVALSFFGGSLTKLITDPGIGNMFILVILAVIAFVGIAGIRWLLRRGVASSDSAHENGAH